MMADESILTGESLPVSKDLQAELFSGTLIVRGKGYMEVTRTGPRSTMGRLATMLGGIEAGQTPLERRLGEFGNQVAIAILAIGAGSHHRRIDGRGYSVISDRSSSFPWPWRWRPSRKACRLS